MHFPAIVLLFVATSTIGFQCPPYERGCRASLLRCGPETGKSFTSFYYTSLRHVLIECEEAPNWVKFKCNNRNAAHDDANRLTFQKCAFPGDYQLKDAVQAVDLIKLDSLTFAHGNLSRIVQNVKAFEGLSGLRELSLFDNGLRDITAELFAVIPDIVLLDLTKNELKDLPSDLFVNLRKLETLELGGNRIGVIEDGTFDPLENLTRLSLRYNLLTTIKPGTFDRLKSLEYLNVKSNKLQQLPSGIFDNLASLKGLHLQNNNFSSLPDGLLRNNLKLTNFHLYNNAQKLTSLPQGFFQNLSSLTALNLKENGLTMLPEDLLHGATSLTIVSFESNTLEYLPQRIFKDMHHLISLNLSNNRLEYLEAGCFENNKELVQLDLSWNLFQHLPNLFLLGFNFILEKINIDFSHNKLVTIGFDKERLMLQLVDSIATLSDREHPIVTVRAEDNPFTCDCDLYSLLQHLESDVQKFVEINVGGTQCRPPRDINLVYNVSVPIAQLDIKKFECPFTLGSHMCPKECTCKTRPYNKVHFINCSYKNLTRVPKKIWSNSDVELDLTGNFIKDIQIDADSGNGYGHVTLLILSHNSLSSLSPLVFTSKLKVIKLDNNNLGRIDAAVLDAMRNSSSLTDLTLDDNPWICDCHARDLAAFIRSSQIPSLSYISCSGSGKLLSEMTEAELCFKPSHMTLFISLSLATVFCVLLVVVLAMICYKFHHQDIEWWLKNRRTATSAIENNNLINSDCESSALKTDVQVILS